MSLEVTAQLTVSAPVVASGLPVIALRPEGATR
uniref:Hypothetical chloroplast RF12 n=1 Tax=Selaginella bisulcata TaxID=1715365 RepID=A0A482CIQ7_9TRAC|nr:hypothetical chloroplast RF12 [Selaginella bisulcata]QBL75947.1 hypothetical chloroplast RF12 [Selaginella bisulcata]